MRATCPSRVVSGSSPFAAASMARNEAETKASGPWLMRLPALDSNAFAPLLGPRLKKDMP